MKQQFIVSTDWLPKGQQVLELSQHWVASLALVFIVVVVIAARATIRHFQP